MKSYAPPIGFGLIVRRLLAMVISLVLGPAIAALLSLGATILIEPGVIETRTTEVILGTAVVTIFAAMMMGLPIVSLAMLIGLLFIAAERITLGATLAVTAIATLAWSIVSSERDLVEMLTTEDLYIWLTLALTTAAICWRLTKRLHSP